MVTDADVAFVVRVDAARPMKVHGWSIARRIHSGSVSRPSLA